MLDLVFLAMFAVLPVLAWSVWQVRAHRRFGLHKRVQLTLAAVLLVAVVLFEIDMRFLSGWRRATPSPYYASVYATDPLSYEVCYELLGFDCVPGWVFRMLAIHLVFAGSTALLWVLVVVQALRHFPHPPVPGPHSRTHQLPGWVATVDMAMTALTGWIFYWLAFVA